MLWKTDGKAEIFLGMVALVISLVTNDPCKAAIYATISVVLVMVGLILTKLDRLEKLVKRVHGIKEEG